MNIQQAWNVKLSGQSIIVGVVDDGVELEHPDMKDNVVCIA